MLLKCDHAAGYHLTSFRRSSYIGWQNMHEFCPLCLKNGAKIRIKSFQINFQEAVFMCASEKCTWPVGYEDLTLMNRPVGKEWSSSWDESALKYVRSEQDSLFEFSSYTPPRTPSNEAAHKDTSNSNPAYSVPVESNFTLRKENVSATREIICSSSSSKPSDKSVDSSFGNRTNVKPKVVVSKSVNYTLEKYPTQGYTFKKINENNSANSELRTKVNDCKNNVPTSLVSNSISVKKDEYDNRSSATRVSRVNEGSRLSGRSKKKTYPYEKFDFDKLVKPNGTHVNKVNGKEDSVTLEPNEKTEAKKISRCNSHSSESGVEIISENNECFNGDSASVNKTNVGSVGSGNGDEFGYNSVLALSNSSKDSGVVDDSTGKDTLDAQLDELLSIFSEKTNDAGKTDATNPINTEDYEWINSLFE